MDSDPHYVTLSNRWFKDFIEENDFKIESHSKGTMGEWIVSYSDGTHLLNVCQDRGARPSVEIGTSDEKWSLAHLRGFLGGLDKHHHFQSDR